MALRSNGLKDESREGKLDEKREAGVVAGAISDAATRLAHIAMPRVSPRATTTCGADSVTVVLRGIGDPAQDTLFAPSSEDVVRLRSELHRIMREDLVGKIERHLSRRVLAFVDQSGTERDTVAYMYMLTPAGKRKHEGEVKR
jgi:Na+-translocating membrane potential-generating system (MpsC)